MKYCKFLILLIVCFLASCSNNGIEETATKQEYLDKLEKLSDNARQKQLKKDIDYLTNLLQSTQTLQVYNRNVSKKTDERVGLTGIVEPFYLTSSDSIQFEFKNLTKAKVTQQYGIPTSNFDIQIEDSLLFADQTQFLYQIDSAYIKNGVADPFNVSLVAVDSVLVNIDYQFVTSVDTIKILASSEIDSIFYKKDKIKIVEQSDNSLKIIYPLNIGLVDYRAIAASGGLPMLYKSSSDFSIFSISDETVSTLKQMLDVLKSVRNEANKELALKKLKDLSDDQFRYLDALKNFKLMYDKEILNSKGSSYRPSELPAEFIKEYKSLLSPISKELTLTFDKPYSSVMLYVASKHKTIKKQLIARPNKDDLHSFSIYKDNNSRKYGIVGRDAKIIIPAMYDQLLQDDDLYYRLPDPAQEKQDRSYFLDTIQKVLRPLSSDIKFVKVLDNNNTVFENSKGKKGVLSKNKVEIVPYRYEDIVLHGKTIIAKGTTSNDLFYELFNIGGKKINLPQIKSIKLIEGNSSFIIKSIDGKEGFINKEGVATIRPHYYGLRLINDNLIKYNTDRTYDEYSAKDYLWGIVSADGEEITKPKYYSVGFFSEDMAPVYIKNGDILRGGYINSMGEIAIDPNYLFVNEFYKGYALVRVIENYCLIDKQGKIVKSFPKGTYVELINYADQSKGSLYETSDGIDYDYQGKPIK